MHPIKYTLLTLIFLVSITASISAQLNIKTGYIYSHTRPDVTNQIFDQFNNERTWLSDNLKDLNGFHGLIMGFRYKPLDFVGFDLYWTGRFRSIKSFGTDPVTSSSFERDLYFRNNSISVGYENYLKWFSFGGTLDFNFLKIKSESSSRDGRFTILSDTGFSSHFFISFNAQNRGRMSVSLKPYIQIPWTGFDVKKLAEELDATPDNTTDFNERYPTFGFMIVFYNGYDD